MAYNLRLIKVTSKGGSAMKRSVYDKQNVRLEEVAREDYIPFLSGRPFRELIINEDDIMNLIIAMNTSHSLEEFLQYV